MRILLQCRIGRVWSVWLLIFFICLPGICLFYFIFLNTSHKSNGAFLPHNFKMQKILFPYSPMEISLSIHPSIHSFSSTWLFFWKNIRRLVPFFKHLSFSLFPTLTHTICLSISFTSNIALFASKISTFSLFFYSETKFPFIHFKCCHFTVTAFTADIFHLPVLNIGVLFFHKFKTKLNKK